MNIFLALLIKLIPLYIIIFLGYIGGKFLKVQKETLSAILIYIMYPIIVFTGVITINLNLSTLSLPLLIFFMSCILCLIFYGIAGFIWKDSTRNILAFTSGNANTAYFGIPIALILFPPQLIGIYILSVIGITFYENTLGFFITAKGHHTAMDSFRKLLKLPTVYALLLGIVFTTFHIQLPQIYFDNAANFRAAFSILGMMIIGLGLASIKEFKFDFKFLAMSFLAKFICWPLFVVLIIFIDSHFFHLYEGIMYKILLLVSVTPLAANTVVFATELKTHPEKASFAVFLSTIFALFYIPLFILLFFK